MKTKNLFGWLAMAAMLAGTGCSTDEVVNDYSPNNAIEFGTYVGRNPESRVAETTLTTLQGADWGFGVYAHYKVSGGTATSNPNFMNNQKVAWNTATSAWEYAPVKYWPNNDGDEITFWAYAPWDAENTSTTATVPSFKVADGTDYVAATSVTKSKSTVNDVDDKVKFEFKHVMSKVGFKVEAIIDELEHDPADGQTTANGTEDETTDETTNTITNKTTIVVTKVTLNGTLAESGTMNWTNNAWTLITDQATSKSHVLTPDNFANKNTYTCKITQESDQGKKEYKLGQAVTIEKADLNDANSYLMLVPQNVGINIEVEYSVITQDANLATGFSCVDNKIKSSDFNFNFEGGKAYNFVLHLGLTSVKLEAEVSGWEIATDYVVNVPLNIADNDAVTPAP